MPGTLLDTHWLTHQTQGTEVLKPQENREREVAWRNGMEWSWV